MDTVVFYAVTILSGLTLVVLVLIMSLRSVMDSLEMLGFLPQKFRRVLLAKRQSEIKQILEELGFSHIRSKIESLTENLSGRNHELISIDEAENDMENFIIRSIEKGNFSFGLTRKIKSNSMINLRKFILS